MIKKNKNMLFIVGIICLMISAICFVSYSNTDIQDVIIKSMTPIYDDNDTYSVGNTGVIFNDKDQVVKYNIVVENTRDYDVKVTDLKLGTKSQEFLKYEVKNVELDEVIKPGETKELVISFETVKMDGWGRNFNDEIVTTLVFDRVLINPEPSVPNNNQNNEVPKVETAPDNSGNVVVQPEVNEPVVEEPKEEINNEVVVTPDEDANHELGMEQEIIVKDSNTGDVFVIFCFGIATGVLGIGLVMVNKNKFVKYIVVFIVIGSSVKLASANEVFSLEIPINVSYESQNVMMTSECIEEEGLWCESDFWKYHYKYLGRVKNFYIQNELSEKIDYVKKSDVSEKQDGRVIGYIVESEEDSSYYDVYLQADGIIYANEDASYYFAAMRNLQKIDNLEGFDTSKVTNMSWMFFDTGYHSENFTLDLSDFDTSNVTDMSYMFAGTGSNDENFTLDVSGFDTSQVTDMSYMFAGTGSNDENFTLDLSDFDTSNVTNMSYMFSYTGCNSTNFTLDLSNFDTSNVTDMGGMFSETGYNSSNFILDLSNFDTSNVTNMSSMFALTGGNNPNFTLDLSNFDTSNVTNMGGMFSETGYSNPNFTLDLSNFDTSNVTNMGGMFSETGYSNPNFTLDLSNFDTSNVTNMGGMFYKTGYNSSNFTLDLSNFDTSNVTNMYRMFNETGYNSTNLTLDLSNFDTSNVTDMGEMFYATGYNSSNFTLDVSNFDTSNVTDMEYMFRNTGYSSTNFILDVSNFDTSKVTKMSFMFYYTGHNSTNFNTSITIKNPNFYSSDYRLMFDGVATQPGSKIIVNYTSETAALVDKMIATKSSNSNVVKGWNVDNIISFNIIDLEGQTTTYTAYEGMTWGDWIDSEFNNDGYWCEDYWVKLKDSTSMIVSVGENSVNSLDIINGNYSYEVVEISPR